MKFQPFSSKRGYLLSKSDDSSNWNFVLKQGHWRGGSRRCSRIHTLCIPPWHGLSIRVRPLETAAEEMLTTEGIVSALFDDSLHKNISSWTLPFTIIKHLDFAAFKNVLPQDSAIYFWVKKFRPCSQELAFRNMSSIKALIGHDEFRLSNFDPTYILHNHMICCKKKIKGCCTASKYTMKMLVSTRGRIWWKWVTTKTAVYASTT